MFGKLLEINDESINKIIRSIFSPYLSSFSIGRGIICSKPGWKLCATSLKTSVSLSENRKWWALSMKCRDDFTQSLSGHSVMKTYESFLPLCLLQAPSPNASYLIFYLYLSFYYSLHWPFVCRTVFVLYFLPPPWCREFTCLVDPEVVNLVIHNR